MVDRLDECAEIHSQQVAYEWHESLEDAEPETYYDHLAKLDASSGKSLADCDCKGVHAKAYSDEEELEEAHAMLLCGKSGKKEDDDPPESFF